MGLNLIGKIELDGAGFERGLHKATDRVTEFAKAAVVTAFGFYGVEEAIKKTVEMASDLVNESKRLDVTIDQLELMRQAAKDAGSDMSAVATAMEKINDARGKIMRGDPEGAKLLKDFERLGVSEKMLQTQTAASLLMGPISGTVKGENVQNITAQLKEIMGKGAGDLVSFLKTDFDEVGETLKKFGLKMDTDTAVKLKHLGDGFDLVAKIIAVLLGPALVKFAVWLLQAFAHSPHLESIDFLAKRHAELAKQPNFTNSKGETWTAKQRADVASDFIDTVQRAMKQGMSFEEFKKTNPYRFQGAFEDFKGGSYKDLNAYIGKLNNPVNEATEKAGKESSNDMVGIQKTVDDFMAKLEKEAHDLDNPQPINPENDDPVKAKHIKAIPSDSLIKVGNFLGANGNTISRVDQRKINLLQKIADNTKPHGGTSSGGTFADPFFVGMPNMP